MTSKKINIIFFLSILIIILIGIIFTSKNKVKEYFYDESGNWIPKVGNCHTENLFGTGFDYQYVSTEKVDQAKDRCLEHPRCTQIYKEKDNDNNFRLLTCTRGDYLSGSCATAPDGGKDCNEEQGGMSYFRPFTDGFARGFKNIYITLFSKKSSRGKCPSGYSPIYDEGEDRSHTDAIKACKLAARGIEDYNEYTESINNLQPESLGNDIPSGCHFKPDSDKPGYYYNKDTNSKDTNSKGNDRKAVCIQDNMVNRFGSKTYISPHRCIPENVNTNQIIKTDEFEIPSYVKYNQVLEYEFKIQDQNNHGTNFVEIILVNKGINPGVSPETRTTIKNAIGRSIENAYLIYDQKDFLNGPPVIHKGEFDISNLIKPKDTIYLEFKISSCEIGHSMTFYYYKNLYIRYKRDDYPIIRPPKNEYESEPKSEDNFFQPVTYTDISGIGFDFIKTHQKDNDNTIFKGEYIYKKGDSKNEIQTEIKRIPEDARTNIKLEYEFQISDNGVNQTKIDMKLYNITKGTTYYLKEIIKDKWTLIEKGKCLYGDGESPTPVRTDETIDTLKECEDEANKTDKAMAYEFRSEVNSCKIFTEELNEYNYFKKDITSQKEWSHKCYIKEIIPIIYSGTSDISDYVEADDLVQITFLFNFEPVDAQKLKFWNYRNFNLTYSETPETPETTSVSAEDSAKATADAEEAAKQKAEAEAEAKAKAEDESDAAANKLKDAMSESKNAHDDLMKKLKDNLELNRDNLLGPTNPTTSVGGTTQALCSFDVSNHKMETLFKCKQDCLKQHCDIDTCKKLCDNCTHSNCKWTKINYNKTLIPKRTIIRGFSGNGCIKITWIKPSSSSEILKYYIIITKTKSDFIEIYSYINNDELLEYTIDNLDINTKYNIYIVSKNKIGISEISNKILLKPNKNEILCNSNNKYEPDNNNQYKSDILQYEKQKSIYEKQVIINELETILVDKLKFKTPIGVYNVNVY